MGMGRALESGWKKENEGGANYVKRGCGCGCVCVRLCTCTHVPMICWKEWDLLGSELVSDGGYFERLPEFRS